VGWQHNVQSNKATEAMPDAAMQYQALTGDREWRAGQENGAFLYYAYSGSNSIVPCAS
jgi:hypothetical protein